MPLVQAFINKTDSFGRSLGKIGAWSQKAHFGNMKHACRIINGKPHNKMQLERLVEACYIPEYANLMIKLADPVYMGEQPRFIAAVNWLECAVSGLSIAMGQDVDWGEDLAPNSTPFATRSW